MKNNQMKRTTPLIWGSGSSLGLLRLNKTYFVAIIFRANGEVNPVAPCAVALDKELIIILLRAIRDVQQDRSIADGLFKA